MAEQGQQRDAVAACKALNAALREKGFDIVSVGVGQRDGKPLLYVYTTTMKQTRLVERCLEMFGGGQWQTYALEVRRVGGVRPATA